MTSLTLAGADGLEPTRGFSASCWPAAQQDVRSQLSDFLDKMRALAAEFSSKKSEPYTSRDRLLVELSDHCTRIAASLEADIERNARGLPFEGRFGEFFRWNVGEISRWLETSIFHPFSRNSPFGYLGDITIDDVRKTEGFRRLKARCDSIGVALHLEESRIEWAKYGMIVRITGWGK